MSSMTSLNPMSSSHHQHLGSHHHSSSGLSPSPLGSSPLGSSHLVSSLGPTSIHSGTINSHSTSLGHPSSLSHTSSLSHHSSIGHTPLSQTLGHGGASGSPRSPPVPSALTPLPQDCHEYPSADDKVSVASANAAAAAAWKNYHNFQSL